MGHLLRVQSAALWPVPEPPGVCTLHRSSDSAAEAAGHSSGYISRRLAPSSTIGAGSCDTDVCRREPSNRSGFHNKHRKECVVSGTTYNLSGFISGLISFTASLSVERVKAFRACLALFRLHRTVRFRLCLRLLGLIASAILVV